MERQQQTIETFASLCTNINDVVLSSEIAALRDKVAGQNLYVVVVGLFKRGKSSLINALIGADIAPVAITPLTAIITVLKYADTPHAEVRYADGRTETIPIEQITGFVSEEQNPQNVKKVALVTIFHTSPLLRRINLVDTPGLGSVYEHNTETTLQFIPKIDAAMLVLSADNPISKTDILFLQEMKATVHKFLFVMNKADLLSVEDLAKMISYNSENLAKTLHLGIDQARIMSVSCKNNIGIDTLRKSLEDVAENEKGELLAKSTERQFNSLRSKAVALIQLRIDSLLTPVNLLSGKLQYFRTSKSLLEHNKGDFEILINGKIKQLGELIHATICEEAEKLETEMKKEIEAHYRNGEMSAEERKYLHTKLNTLVLARFTDAKNVLEGQAKEHFRGLLHDYASRSQNFLYELSEQLSSVMDMRFDLIIDKFDLDVYTSFYLTLDGAGGDMRYAPEWYFLFASPSFKRQRVLRKVVRHYHDVIVMNKASVIYDLQYKVQESLRKFSYDLNLRLYELLSSMEQIMQETLLQKNTASFESKTEVSRLEQLVSDIKRL